MKRLIDSPKLHLILRIALAGLFLYAGILKLLHIQEFADSIAAYRILPVWAINVVALSLPPMEIILSLFLLAGRHSRLAAFGMSLLLGIFTLALGQAILRGLKIDCGCFGLGAPSQLKLWLSLARDFLLFCVSLWILRQLSEKGEDVSLGLSDRGRDKNEF